ncbi:probable peroxisomal acyl-coenzyme A oxidase 1 isoform X2 [Bombus terrestris]|uniref:Acyl-coenzyme A oxidase n=1 Tax=Bombus terrestris TaxID=30195 RepID=A0A9C6SXR6_BOMTE|nr:probable peroxisomal acyl-coenzyme A oxidase 1 isoform X2 [Bombus terrestris]
MTQQRKTVHKDLQYERNRCTFDPVEVTYFLDGSPEKTKQRRDQEQYISDVLVLKENMSMRYKSYKEVYEDSLRIARAVLSKIKKLQLSKIEEYEFVHGIFSERLGSALFQDGNPLSLHYGMFLPTLMGQANSEQQAYWINRAWTGDVIGTYAQTELGHGTFLRGLETTATYDPETKEFVLNSPTLTSYKWWPGGLGHTANHAIVVAQLYTQGECRGIHPFVVQLRDVETHEPLKNIIIGEIGAKLGMNGVNNGFLGFRNYRIPRKNMLMKNSKVLEDGTYAKSANDKLTYGTMVFVRVMLLQDLLHYLSKAVTIAVRYSVVRRQGQINAEQPEVQILDYVTQQYKIFPHIATCFAIKVTAIWLLDMYKTVQSQLHQADYKKLPELHSLSCCLKAVVSADTAAGIEQLRLSCGGHGYMTASNLPVLYGFATAVCTYEGENTVLLLQTARSIRLAAEHLDRRIRDGVPTAEAWNQTSIELTQCAEAHARVFIVKTFANDIKQLNSKSEEFRQVMFQLCELYIVYWALRNVGNFLRFSSMQEEHVQTLHSRLEYLLMTIRRNAVGIVDGFDFDDHILCSALGAYDGNVYERLFQEAMKSPLNRESVNISFEKYLKPFLKSNL